MVTGGWEGPVGWEVDAGRARAGGSKGRGKGDRSIIFLFSRFAKRELVNEEIFPPNMQFTNSHCFPYHHLWRPPHLLKRSPIDKQESVGKHLMLLINSVCLSVINYSIEMNLVSSLTRQASKVFQGEGDVLIWWMDKEEWQRSRGMRMVMMTTKKRFIRF
jgi:hypothetical protein